MGKQLEAGVEGCVQESRPRVAYVGSGRRVQNRIDDLRSRWITTTDALQDKASPRIATVDMREVDREEEEE